MKPKREVAWVSTLVRGLMFLCAGCAQLNREEAKRIIGRSKTIDAEANHILEFFKKESNN